jgi:transposase InsO family protein
MRDFLKLIILISIPTKQNLKVLAIEVLVLRQQLAVLQREKTKPRLKKLDRLFWVCVSKVWSNWKNALILIKPETVIGWHQKGFRLFWKIKCRNGKRGRPKIPVEVRNLIRKISTENPTWGSPRIEGELSKLGYTVRKSTVERYMVKKPKPLSPTWRTFLKNHAKDIVACDFFTVPTITFSTLHVLLFIEHARRKIVHFNISESPFSAWAAQQLTNAFPYDSAPRFLIHDRDTKFLGTFQHRAKVMNIKQILTARKAPKMNAYAERFVLSIKNECLNRMIPIGETHLRCAIKEFVDHYHQERNHQGLGNELITPHIAEFDPNGTVKTRERLGGLLNFYYQEATK